MNYIICLRTLLKMMPSYTVIIIIIIIQLPILQKLCKKKQFKLEELYHLKYQLRRIILRNFFYLGSKEKSCQNNKTNFEPKYLRNKSFRFYQKFRVFHCCEIIFFLLQVRIPTYNVRLGLHCAVFATLWLILRFLFPLCTKLFV